MHHVLIGVIFWTGAQECVECPFQSIVVNLQMFVIHDVANTDKSVELAWY